MNNTLILVEENNLQKTVLKASIAENFFWHATEAEGQIFVQEYGQSPTSIYVSEDLQKWRRVATNVDLDRGSKHFHYIIWDPYRKWLITTLGDKCLTRVAYSEDFGQTWRPLYRGAWQFVPAVSLDYEVVFGMDSGIAKGGIGIFNFSKRIWRFIFLEWRDESIRTVQMADLKRLSNNIWVSALGAPQAIIASKDMRSWYLIHIGNISKEFNFHMKIAVEGNIVACSTGDSLILLDKDELESLFNTEPIILSYRAYIDKLKGLSFSLKARSAYMLRTVERFKNTHV